MTITTAPLALDAAPVPDAGLGALSTERGNLPLDAVDVRAVITGLTAGVEVTQGFHNPFDVPLEATYIFPLPDRAAVTGLRMEADGRVVDATLHERSRARAAYDEAVASGRRAAIAEEDRPDVFALRVGNILPGERVTVRLSLDQPLPYEDGAATFRFPLVVAPRYVPGEPTPGAPAGPGTAADTDTTPDASRISSPVLLPGFPAPVRLTLTVDIDPVGLPVSRVESSLHVVTSAIDGDTTRLSVRPGERLDRDFVLRLAMAAPDHALSALLVPDPQPGRAGDAEHEGDAVQDGDGTFVVTVVPGGGDPTARPRPRDLVLVLDRSGSMGGWKMVAARRAAARIVDTLNAADRFAVLSFDTTVERPHVLGPGLAEATDRHRFRAVEHLAALEARGGTEMLRPLQEAVALLGDGEGRDRVLVLVTDGQVGNEDDILAAVAPSLAGVRVHTVGIDRAVNAGFLGRLATIGRGRVELVESEDRLDQAMERIHQRIAAPQVTGVELAWSGLEVVEGSVVPDRPATVYPGVPLVISGRYRAAEARPAATTVTATGRTGGGAAWEHRVGALVTDHPSATRVWARAQLRTLEDRYAVQAVPDLEHRIVATSLRHGVLCRFTAFVAVDSRAVTDGSGPHRVVQPVELPSGWAPAPGPFDGAHAARQSAAGPVPAPAVMPAGRAGPVGAPARVRAMRAGPAMSPSPGGRVRSPASSRPRGGTAAVGTMPGGTVPAGAVPAGGAGDPREEGAAAECAEAAARGLADEVAGLRDLADAPDGRRWAHLSDLRSRLAGLLVALRGAAVPVEQVAALAALVAALELADDQARWDADLDALWSWAVEVLTGWVPRGDVALAAAVTTPNRPFWKPRPGPPAGVRS